MMLDEKQVAVIPAGTVIKGNIEISGKMEMFGKVTGNIKSDDRVNLCGEVLGDIKANDLYARDAFVEGNIDAMNEVVILENSVVLGNVDATNLTVDGAVQGNFDIKGNMTIGENAKVDGDIKAKTIQVHNGAATNGKLDLCYADVKAKDIFPKVFDTKVSETNRNKNNTKKSAS